jgi:hypothetical protein
LIAAALLIASPSTHAQVLSQPQPIRAAISREAARLARAPRPHSVAQPAPPRHRNWFARHPVLTGTIAGAGVGLAVMGAKGCSGSSDYTCPGLLLFAGGTGAGLGAVGGLVAAVILH